MRVSRHFLTANRLSNLNHVAAPCHTSHLLLATWSKVSFKCNELFNLDYATIRQQSNPARTTRNARIWPQYQANQAICRKPGRCRPPCHRPAYRRLDDDEHDQNPLCIHLCIAVFIHVKGKFLSSEL